MAADSQDPGGGFLLELFRDEVRSHSATLAEGLVALEQEPKNPTRIEPLMRAAHSIKGAARIVRVELAVQLAHLMEDVLVAAQQGKLLLEPAHIDLLLTASDGLLQIGEATAQNYDDWLKTNTAMIESLCQQLEIVSSGGTLPASHAPAAAEHPATAPANAAATVAPESSGPPANRPPVSEPPPAPASPAPAPAVSVEKAAAPVDNALLELFREEVRSGYAVLNEGLVRVEQSGGDPQVIEPLMRAAHSIKGAARIVNLSSIVQIAHAMEDCLVAAQNRQIRLSASDIDLLLQSADLLQILSEGTASEASNQSEVVRCIQHLHAVVKGEAPPAAVTPPPAPTAVAAIAPAPDQPAVPQPNASPSTPNVAPPTDIATTTSIAGVQSAAGSPAATSTTDTGPTRSSTPAKPADSPPEKDAKQRVVRVTAQNLTRLMSLAGESLVEARWLGPFGASLQKLKKMHDHLANSLDALSQFMTDSGTTSLVADMRRRLAECRQELSQRLDEIEVHARQTADLNSRLYHEVIDSRMRPFADGVQGFPRLIRDLSRQLGKKVQFEIEGNTTPVDRDILEQLEAPLNHLLRNALDHGIELPDERVASGKSDTALVKLQARHRAGMLMITVTDDGRGIAEEKLRRKIVARGLSTPEMVAVMTQRELFDFLFLPGFSTTEKVTEVSGRGVGLDVVHSMVHSVGGHIHISSELGRGTSFHLQLPITLSVMRAVLADIGGEPYAFPQNRLERLLRIPRDQLKSLEGRQYFTVDGRNVGTVQAQQILELDGPAAETDELSIILLGDETRPLGLVVDRFRGEQDLVVRPLDSRLGRVPHVSAAALLDDGAPILIVDVDDMMRGIDQILTEGKLRRLAKQAAVTQNKKQILVVDDSITVREVQRQLLQANGYAVTTAVDGVDGWHTLQTGEFDLVISDIDMPRMNGFDLVRSIKENERLRRIPVIIVSYKDRPEDRMKGLEVGANSYLTKSSFHDETLLETVVDLIGK